MEAALQGSSAEKDPGAEVRDRTSWLEPALQTCVPLWGSETWAAFPDRMPYFSNVCARVGFLKKLRTMIKVIIVWQILCFCAWQNCVCCQSIYFTLHTITQTQKNTHRHMPPCAHSTCITLLSSGLIMQPREVFEWGLSLPQLPSMGSHVCANIMSHITFFPDWSSTHPLLFLLINLLSCNLSSMFFSFSWRGAGH